MMNGISKAGTMSSVNSYNDWSTLSTSSRILVKTYKFAATVFIISCLARLSGQFEIDVVKMAVSHNQIKIIKICYVSLGR